MNDQLGQSTAQKTTAEYMCLMVAYESAIDHIIDSLRIIEQELNGENQHSPIHSITSRVKSLESSQKKLARHGLPYTIENVANKLNDVAGVRAICKYISDIYLVRDRLLSSPLFTIVREKDYIKEPKSGGYRSLHLTAEVEVPFDGSTRKVRCEIQLRTSAMDSWASLEHSMRYKNNLPENEQINESLKKCSDALYGTDLEMQRIAHQLGIISDEQYERSFSC